MNKLSTPVEFKFSKTPGCFEGYCSTFDKDTGGDQIIPGAWQKFKTTRDGKIRLLWQHDPRHPIGLATVKEDSQGLYLFGELALEDETAAKAHGLMKAGVLDAMSVGFGILPEGSKWDEGTRFLLALELWEVSVVTWGMNEGALIDTVKSCASPRDLEHMLREIPQFQLSSRKAKAAANALWPILSARDAQEDDRDDRSEEKFAAMASTLNSINSILKGTQ